MALALYTDEHVAAAIADGLVGRGIDVLRIQDDGGRTRDDEWVLNRAHRLNRVLFTMDVDFLALAAARHRDGVQFSGVVYTRQLHLSIGQIVTRLESICRKESTETMMNRVVFL